MPRIGRPQGKAHHCPRCGHIALTDAETKTLVALAVLTSERGATAQALSKITEVSIRTLKRCIRMLRDHGLAETAPGVTRPKLEKLHRATELGRRACFLIAGRTPALERQSA